MLAFCLFSGAEGDPPAAKKSKMDDDLECGLPDLMKGMVTEVK